MPWVVDMRYENKKAGYPDDLPRQMRPKIHHDISEGVVVCLLNVGLSKTANIPGARWVSSFSIPPQEIEEKPDPKFATLERDQTTAATTALLDVLDDQDLWDKLKLKFALTNPAERENIPMFKALSELRDRLMEFE